MLRQLFLESVNDAAFVRQVLKRVTEYESTIGGIVLDPEASKENPMYFSTRNSHTIPADYHEVYEQKALMILRMLEIRIGRELLLQVRICGK